MKTAKNIAKLLALTALTGVVYTSFARADQDPWSELYNAITYEDVAKAKTALTGNINWANDGKTDHQYTTLHFAVGHMSSNGIEILKLLLETQANVNARAEYLKTPLHFAAAGDNTIALKLLIAHGADVNAQQRDGKTPLHLAATKGHFEIVKILLENKADIKVKDNYHNTALMCAVVKKQKEIEKILRQSGAKE